ncbi:MAG: acyl-CoA reductase [Saprospiraceae bacterium]
MNLSKRIEVLVYLGGILQLKEEELIAAQQISKNKNSWFTLENSDRALQNIITIFLQKEKLVAWAKQYEVPEIAPAKTIGIIMSGSSPLAGFHDLLGVFVSGHHAKIKLSADDKFLIPYCIKVMKSEFPEVENYFSFVERMTDFDAIIANGSRDSIKVFKTYFSKFPNIVRTNKFGIGVLDGKESTEELAKFGEDIFHYFGLSSRSVSKIYIPENYDFVPLLEASHEFNNIVLTNKYKNNFDHNYTLQIINKMDYKANGCIIIIEDEALQSRIAMLHYEVYKGENHLAELLKSKYSEIQHIISNNAIPFYKNKKFGAANVIELDDYENGIDVMYFLKELN